MGIEPTAQAWEAWVLPLYDARIDADVNAEQSKRQPGSLQTVGNRRGWARRIYRAIPQAPSISVTCGLIRV